MRVGWRGYLKKRLQKPSPFYSLGLELGIEEVHLCVCQQRNGTLTWVKQTVLSPDSWATQLKEYVNQHQLSNTQCYVALANGSYHLLNVERPQVADDELRQALTWSVKDLVPAQDDLVVDYFDVPVKGAGTQKLNVVAMAKPGVEEIVQNVTHAGLELKSIGIAELAQCDLLPYSDEATMTLLQQPGQGICLNIVKNGELYFTRSLKGYENLGSFSEQELQMGVGDNLSVEIQRSMDYFESQLRQAPVKRIVLGIDSPHLDKLADIMQRLTFVSVTPIEQPVPADRDLHFNSGSYASLGAALLPHRQAA